MQKVAKDEIIQLLQTYQTQVRALGVKRLGLFGSFVREEARPDSDVDFWVEFEPGRKTFDNFIQLAFLLEEWLQRPVELVTPESVSPYIRPFIESEGNYLPPSVALIVRREGHPRIRHEYTNDGAIRAFVKYSWTARPAQQNQGR